MMVSVRAAASMVLNNVRVWFFYKLKILERNFEISL